MELNFHKS